MLSFTCPLDRYSGWLVVAYAYSPNRTVPTVLDHFKAKERSAQLLLFLDGKIYLDGFSVQCDVGWATSDQAVSLDQTWWRKDDGVDETVRQWRSVCYPLHRH